MSERFALTLDTVRSIERVQGALSRLPVQVRKAQSRALRKLRTWVQRQVLRAAAQATGATQKALKAALRFTSRSVQGGFKVWVGTNPIQAQFLGKVSWTRRMTGARVGRRTFAGAWSWGPGSRTGTAVMHRTGEFVRRGRAARERIEPVTVEIHEAVSARMSELQGAIAERFQTLLLQELNYALQVEGAR